jgi:WD40 repeat protein
MASNVNDKTSSSIYCHACGAANHLQALHCFACYEPLAILAAGTGPTTNPLTGLLLPDVIIKQRYRILEVLSTNDVSTVYKAEDTQLGSRVVALKEIGHTNQATPETMVMVEASRREMFVLAGLIHPNLPRIYDYFVENQHWYFVMDFLSGETLEDYLKKKNYRPLPAEEVIDAAIQLSTVLEYLQLHQPPLILNDLSLSNIWRTPDGKLYLLDICSDHQAGVVPGNRSITSLGKILRQLQTGKISGTPRLRNALPKLTGQPQSLPLKLFINQMMHNNAGKRPYSMGVVKQEMQLLVMQSSPAPPHKKLRFSRRRLLKIGGFAGLALATSTLTWLAESAYLGGIPHPGYSSDVGGTICTYYTGSGVLGVAWSPDGKRLVMGNVNGKVQTWDANTGLNVINYQAPHLQQRVEDVTWLPDGKSIAAGGDDALVWVWDAVNGKIRSMYRGHTNWVISLACSPDSRYIASGSYDQTVQVWEAATGHPLIIYSGHSGYVTSVAWSPDGRYIASSSFDTTVQIFEAATGGHIFNYTGHSDSVYAVAWSPDGQHLASGDVTGIVKVWPVALFDSNGQPQNSSVVTYNQQANANLSNDNRNMAVQAVAWSPDSNNIASVAHDIEIWNSHTGKHIFTYTNHNNSLAEVCKWSPNGRYIASGGIEGTVQVWNARNVGNTPR